MSSKSKARILVVEDESLIRWDLMFRLEEAGFEVVEAGSAAEATHILEGNDDIRVVFTDIQMPGKMDGLALAHYVRKRWPPTVIIIASGNMVGFDELPENVALFSKPYDWDKWPKLLNSIMAQLA